MPPTAPWRDATVATPARFGLGPRTRDLAACEATILFEGNYFWGIFGVVWVFFGTFLCFWCFVFVFFGTILCFWIFFWGSFLSFVGVCLISFEQNKIKQASWGFMSSQCLLRYFYEIFFKNLGMGFCNEVFKRGLAFWGIEQNGLSSLLDDKATWWAQMGEFGIWTFKRPGSEPSPNLAEAQLLWFGL